MVILIVVFCILIITFLDVESIVAKRVGPVDLYHVNHHGSPFSSGDNLLNVIKPTAAVISVGNDNEHGHPGQECLDRLDKLKTEIFMTEKGVKGRNLHGAVVANGDIVITTNGKRSFTVTAGKRAKKFSLKGTTFPKCKDGDIQDEKIPKITK